MSNGEAGISFSMILTIEWLATLERSPDNWMVFETSYAQADYLHCGVLQTMVQWSSSMRVKLVALH